MLLLLPAGRKTVGRDTTMGNGIGKTPKIGCIHQVPFRLLSLALVHNLNLRQHCRRRRRMCCLISIRIAGIIVPLNKWLIAFGLRAKTVRPARALSLAAFLVVVSPAVAQRRDAQESRPESLQKGSPNGEITANQV